MPKKTHVVHIALSEEDYLAFTRFAYSNNLSISSFGAIIIHSIVVQFQHSRDRKE